MERLRQLLDELPEDLRQQVFTHASWTDRRSDSYSRLAFLGDSVLGLAITAHLYPRLEAERYGAGRLTKIRAQSVSGVSCRAVAERLGVPDRLRATAPSGIGQSAEALVETERVLASVVEAAIGACYLAFGYEETAAAVVEDFAEEIDAARRRFPSAGVAEEHPLHASVDDRAARDHPFVAAAQLWHCGQ